MGQQLEDLNLAGTVNMAGADTVHHKAGAMLDAGIGAAAAIQASKNEHFRVKETTFNFDESETPTTKTVTIGRCNGATGTLKFFRCRLMENGSSTNIDFDLKVNATTVLSAVVNVDHNDADGTVLEGTINDAPLAVGDVITIVMTVTSATGATGPWASVEYNEDYPTT